MSRRPTASGKMVDVWELQAMYVWLAAGFTCREIAAGMKIDWRIAYDKIRRNNEGRDELADRKCWEDYENCLLDPIAWELEIKHAIKSRSESK